MAVRVDALGGAALARRDRGGRRHRALRRGHHRRGRGRRGRARGSRRPGRPHRHYRRHRLGGRRRHVPLHVRQRPGRTPARLSGQRVAGRSRLLGGAHSSRGPRRVGPLLRRVHRSRPRPPVRLPDDRRRRAHRLAAGSRDRPRRRGAPGDAARRDGRHHRAQARRRRAAQQRRALPHARGHGADDGVGLQRRRPAGVHQPAVDRLLRPSDPRRVARRLVRVPASRRPRGLGRRAAPSVRGEAALRGRCPLAPRRWRVSLGDDARRPTLRRVGRSDRLHRHEHRHHRAPARRGDRGSAWRRSSGSRRR